MDEMLTPDQLPPEMNIVFKAVVIKDVGPSKIAYIRLLREVARLDLTTAKTLADKPTPYVLVACDAANAEAFQSLASSAGVTCELEDYKDTMEPAIPNDQIFSLTGAGKTGCAPAALLLAATAAVVIYGLALRLTHG